MENKNIWLVPTKEESVLHLEFGNNWKSKWAIFEKPTKTPDIITSVPHNIYITSNEEPKLDEWGINIKNLALFKGGGFTSDEYSKDCFRKIILTTDNLLIKNGVQAISYYFLKLFKEKNIFEEVEVKKEKVILAQISGTTYVDYQYKISIPEEELNQKLPQLGTKEFNDLASASFGGKPNKNWFHTGEIIEPKEEQPMTKEFSDKLKALVSKTPSKWEEESNKRFESKETLKKLSTDYLHSLVGKRNTGYADEDFENGFKCQQKQIENFCNNRIRELFASKTKFVENKMNDWIEIPDYKISVLKEVLASLGKEVCENTIKENEPVKKEQNFSPKHGVICKSCDKIISLKDINNHLFMTIKGGGLIHWNCNK